MTERAILCGLGRIGWRGFESNGALPTHGSTLEDMSGLRVCIVAGVDIDPVARHHFQTATHRHVYETLTAALAAESPSIVVIATPPETHADLVCEAAACRSVKGIVCEKPMADTVADCRRMIDACAGKALLVAHQRRYEQRHRLLRAFLKSETLGKSLGAVAWFNGGFLNNGTHAADTIRFLVGDDTMSRLFESRGFGVRVACQYGMVELRSDGDLEPGYLKAMYEDLLDCMETGHTPECSGEDGLEAVRLALAAKEANEQAA